MSTPAKVSVVITCYNQEAFIRETLSSVQQQDYHALQIVVVDDASTDASAQVIREVAQSDSRIIFVPLEKNQKVAGARNAGVARASGELIALLDGDDLMHPHKISRQVDYLSRHPEVSVCTHDMEIFESSSGKKLSLLSDRYDAVEGGMKAMLSASWLMGRQMKSVPSSHMYRQAYLRSHRFDTRFQILDDWMHSIDCLATQPGLWGSVPEVLGKRRVHSAQISNNPLSYEEMMMVLTIAQVRYPRFAALIKNKRNHILFEHLLKDWYPEDKRKDMAQCFRQEAGFWKWLHLWALRGYLRSGFLFDLSRPLRRILR